MPSGRTSPASSAAVRLVGTSDVRRGAAMVPSAALLHEAREGGIAADEGALVACVVGVAHLVLDLEQRRLRVRVHDLLEAELLRRLLGQDAVLGTERQRTRVVRNV